MALDTLAYTKHLEQAGVERRQAEAHAEAVSRYVIADPATRDELLNGFASQKNDLTGVETSLRHELTTAVNNLRNEFHTALHQAELRILGVTFAMLGLLFALIKLT